MLLSSSSFFIFLVAIFLLYWPLAQFRAAALGVILLANYFFYAKWDLTYLLLIPAVSSLDFAIGLGLQSSKNPGARRMLVGASILMNVGLLAALRYVPGLSVALPLTLSFYVFQALTYTIDRGTGVLARSARALDEFEIVGIPTTIPLLREIVDDRRQPSGARFVFRGALLQQQEHLQTQLLRPHG